MLRYRFRLLSVGLVAPALAVLSSCSSCGGDQRPGRDDGWSVATDGSPASDISDRGGADGNDASKDVPGPAIDTIVGDSASDGMAPRDVPPDTRADAELDTTSLPDGVVRSDTSDAGNSDADGAGVPSRWTRLLGGKRADQVNEVAVGPTGDIYVAGTDGIEHDGQFQMSSSEPFVARYGPHGTRKWIQRFGAARKSDTAEGLAVGRNGGIYVCGWIKKGLDGETYQGGFGDAYAAKFSARGALRWARLLGSTGREVAFDIDTDGAGGIYVTGAGTQALAGGTFHGGKWDAFLAKFDASGSRDWIHMVGSDESDFGYAVAAVPNRGVYLSGYTGTGLNAGRNALLVAYDAAGTRRWQRTLGKDAETQEALALDARQNGAVYVAGETDSPVAGEMQRGARDYFVARYEHSGTHSWVRLDGTAGSNGDANQVAMALHASGANGILVGGWTDTALANQQFHGGSTDAFVATYDPSGKRTSLDLYGGAGDEKARTVTPIPTSGHLFGGTATKSLHSQSYGGGQTDGLLIYRP